MEAESEAGAIGRVPLSNISFIHSCRIEQRTALARKLRDDLGGAASLKLKLFLDDAAGRDLICCKPRRMFHCEKERKEQAHPAVQLASLALRPRELPMRSRSPLFGFTPFPNGSSALRLGMLPCTVMDVVPRGKTGVTRGHLALT